MSAISASASFTGTWDNHTEYTKNAVDSEHSARTEAAKNGIVLCSKHVGVWVSRPKAGMISKKTEVRDCPQCMTEHAIKAPTHPTAEDIKLMEQKWEFEVKQRNADLEHESRKRELDARLPTPVASPIHTTTNNVPIAFGVQVGTAGVSMDPNKGYSSEWFEVCSDVPVCLCTFCPCCIPFAICDIASRIGAAASHGPARVFLAVLASYCFPCGICMCMDQMIPCFLTNLVKKSMAAHGIGKAPAPCGNAEACCGCWCQMLVCSPCTLALIYREAKTKPIKR